MIDTANALRALQADGIHLIPGFLDRAALAALRRECDALLARRWLDFLWDGSFRFSRPAAHTPGESVVLKLKKLSAKALPEIHRVFAENALSEIASAYLPTGSVINDAAVLSREPMR